jgi:hypothetical protein
LHVQAPAAEHPSPLEPHAVQAPPPTPHADAEGDVHTLLEQQPLGHDAALHTHEPPTHASPAVQAGPPPHEHEPAVQPSALIPQVTQAALPVPQALAEGVVHRLPEQQPLGHVVGLHPAHTPPLQYWVPQSVHAAPPVPHWPWRLPATHVLPLQHPGHCEEVSQTQVPPWQRWPVEHAGPLPHVQAPLEEHPSAVIPQGAQEAPPVPHADAVAGEVQTLPVQQPCAHEVDVQTQTPFEHAWPG